MAEETKDPQVGKDEADESKPDYEAPKVVPLGQLAEALGMSTVTECFSGTGATSSCRDGGLAKGGCLSGDRF